MCSTHVDTYVDNLSNNHLQLYSPISNGQNAITVPFINGISSFSVIWYIMAFISTTILHQNDCIFLL